uniref:Uncharacterized protein n=1 Tax=Arundo donax TaxID=35708 RepID=A0A0A9FFM6_ARUDO
MYASFNKTVYFPIRFSLPPVSILMYESRIRSSEQRPFWK